MKIAAYTLLLASASAFTSTSPSRASTSLSAVDMDTAFGVTIETGNKCPPLGKKMLEDTDEKALKWFQNAEIKNGRVAMIATLGYVSLEELEGNVCCRQILTPCSFCYS